MAAKSRDFYVYAFLRSANSGTGRKYSPYYIGKGKGNRAYSSQRRGAPRPIDSSFIVFIQEGLTEQEAFDLERYCIAVYGRVDLGTGILRNLTDGGDGVSGLVFPEEAIRRLSEVNTGKTLSQSTKDKISAAMSGRKLSEKTRKLISKGHAQGQYELTAPDGTVHLVTNLNAFCEQYNLQRGNVSAVLGGRRRHHRGWTGKVIKRCNPLVGTSLSDEAKERLSKSRETKQYELTSPSGETFTTTNLTAFSKEYGLMQSMMCAVVNGKRKTHRGWTGRIIRHLK